MNATQDSNWLDRIAEPVSPVESGQGKLQHAEVLEHLESLYFYDPMFVCSLRKHPPLFISHEFQASMYSIS